MKRREQSPARSRRVAGQGTCPDQVRMILGIIQQVSSRSDLRDGLLCLADSITRQAEDISRVSVLEWDQSDRRVSAIAVSERKRAATHQKRPLIPAGAVAAALATGTTAFAEQPVVSSPGQWSMAPASRSALCIPIKIGERIVALLAIEACRRRAFRDEEVALFEMLCLYLGHSLQSADLCSALLAKTRKIQRVTDICRRVFSATSLQDAIELAVRSVVDEYGYYCACVALVSDDGRYLEHKAHHSRARLEIAPGYRQDIGRGIVGLVARTRRTVCCNDVRLEPEYVPLVPDVGAELCIPLLAGDTIVGVLDVNSRDNGAFDDEDVRLMETLGGQLALVMDKTRYLDQMRRTRDYLENLFTNAGDGILTLDADGRITRWNRGMEKLTGHAAADKIGTHVRELGWRGSPGRADAFVARAMRGETIEGLEESCKSRDGTVIDVALTMSPIMGSGERLEGVSLIVRDVTERNRMERSFRTMHIQMRDAEEKFLGLIERARDAIFFIDPGAGTIVQANARAEAMTGLNRIELIGKNFLDLHLETEREMAQAHLERSAGAGAAPAMNLRLARASDGPLDVEVTPSILSYGGRQLVQWLCRDISDRSRAEREKQTLQAQLIQSEKLSAIGQLISGVAHELNNPLTGVIGYSQLLAAQECDEKIRRGLEKVYAEAKRCHRVVHNLLTFARKHVPEKQWISVNDILESVLDLRAYQMRVDNIRIERNLSKDLPRTLGDFHQLQQVFMNIVINAHQAFKSSQKGTKIAVATKVAADRIVVEIADDGPGIPPADLKRIFDPFFTTKEPGQGTGLGLSLCYGIIEEHRGRLQVRSRVGEGTVFIIDLPVVTGESVASKTEVSPPEHEPTSPTNGGQTVETGQTSGQSGGFPVS